jgi:hypothetical protein
MSNEFFHPANQTFQVRQDILDKLYLACSYNVICVTHDKTRNYMWNLTVAIDDYMMQDAIDEAIDDDSI